MENFIDKDTQIELLKNELGQLKNENTELKMRLEKYTNNEGHKRYKEHNKGEIQEYQKEYQKNIMKIKKSAFKNKIDYNYITYNEF